MSARSNRVIAACLGAAGLAGAALLGWGVSGAIEARGAAQIGALVQAAGLHWLAVAVDGTRVVLTGEAPDGQGALAALEATRSAGTDLRIVDHMTVAPNRALDERRPAGFALDILRDEHGVALGGLAPNAALRNALATGLAEGLAALGSSMPPADFALDSDGADPPGWETMQAAALAATRALLHGRVSLTSEGVAITGLPRNAIGRAAIERHAARLREQGTPVTLDLVPAPGRAPEPYVFVVEKAAGRLRIVECTLPDTQAVSRLKTAGRQLGAGRGPGCRIAAAAPHSAWTDAAIAALSVLADGPAARVEIEGLQVRVIPAADTIGAAFDATAARLRAALPLGFGLVAAPADAQAGDTEASGTAWVRARLSDRTLGMTGIVPDTATRAAIVSYAAARFGAERVSDTIAVETVAGAEGWRPAVLAGLDALGRLDRGEAFVRDGRIRLWGATTEALAAREAQAALSAVTAAGWTGTTRITVDLPARVASLLLGAEPCITALEAAVAASPILFEPASARIDGSSDAVLDTLAGTLRRCAPLSLVIEGHTDSQGSAAFNNRLSEARAGAVRTALLERGGFETKLQSVGHGPSRPIADNRTETGRALNRRIAFRVAEVPTESTAAFAAQPGTPENAPSSARDRGEPAPSTPGSSAPAPSVRPEIQR